MTHEHMRVDSDSLMLVKVALGENLASTWHL